MRLLLDQDVYAATARHLKSLGHDVVRVSEIGLSRAKDEALLEVSREQPDQKTGIPVRPALEHVVSHNQRATGLATERALEQL